MRFNRMHHTVRGVQAADNSQIWNNCRLAAWMQHAPILGSPVPMHLGNLMV